MSRQRRRAPSYKQIAAAAATFRDSVSPAIEGIRSINSTSKSIEEIATTILRELRLARHVY